MTFSPEDCNLARASVSAELDGELPELERERLLAHLRACAGCSAWAAEVEDATRRLREATLEAPAVSVTLPRRGRRWTVGPAVAVSSAAALVASVVVAIGPQDVSIGSQPVAPRVISHSVVSVGSQTTGVSKLYTGHPVGPANQLGIALAPPKAPDAFGASARVPA